MAQALVEAIGDLKGPISIFEEIEEDKMVNWNDRQDTEMIDRQQSDEGKSVKCSIVRCVEEVVASPTWKGKVQLYNPLTGTRKHQKIKRTNVLA